MTAELPGATGDRPWYRTRRGPAVTGRRCPLCRLPLSNEAAHAPAPELRDSTRDATVYWCLEAERHVAVPLGWWADLKLSVVRALLDAKGSEVRRP